MTDPIDPARAAIQLDQAEEAGLIETDVAEWLRELIAAKERRQSYEGRRQRYERLWPEIQGSAATQQIRRQHATCQIDGPWHHIEVDEQLRGLLRIVAVCGECSRGSPDANVAIDERSASPVRQRALVELSCRRYADGDDDSRDVYLYAGRCSRCRTLHVG